MTGLCVSLFLLELAVTYDAEGNPRLASKCRTYATIALNSAAIPPQPEAAEPPPAPAKRKRAKPA